MLKFNSNIFIIPGLGNSGENHWQTLWEKKYHFTRINQSNWDTPVCEEWIDTIDQRLSNEDLSNTILVAHSLGCFTIAYWAEKYKQKIKGALLVAPSDTEAETYPTGTTGFAPFPKVKMHFPTVVVMSENDFYVTPDRARYFAKAWESDIQNIGNAGHINVASGFGAWNEGLSILKRLDG